MFNTTINLDGMKITMPYDYGNLDVMLAAAVAYSDPEADVEMNIQDVIFDINGKDFMLVVDSACYIWEYWEKIKELAELGSNEEIQRWDFEVEDQQLTDAERFGEMRYQEKYLIIFATKNE